MIAGVVAALAAEARTMGRPARRSGEGAARRRFDGVAVLHDGTLLAVSGVGSAAAERAAERLVASGAAALVSWGVAGALDPTLEPGAICLPSEVIAPDGTRHRTAPQWREWLAERIGAQRAVAGGALLASSRSIDSVEAKAQAHRATGAVAVDMESGAVARTAAAHRMPFLALRAIVDTARDRVPGAVAAASRSGDVRIGRLLWGLVCSPADLAPLVMLARRYRVALHALAEVAAQGPLAPPDLETAAGVRAS